MKNSFIKMSVALAVLLAATVSYAGTMKDSRDGKTYKTVKIGGKEWMAENLNIDYNHGTAKSFCYEDKEENCEKYGRRYLWSAAMDSAAVYSNDGVGCGYNRECDTIGNVRGVCPEGWRLPSRTDFNELRNVALQKVGYKNKAGTVLKSRHGWTNYEGKSGNGTDALGFGALPYYKDRFVEFWSSTQDTSHSEAIALSLRSDEEGAFVVKQRASKRLFSVRCIKISNEERDAIPAQSREVGTKLSKKMQTMKDPRDGQTYKTVKIGKKVWMAENLNFDYNYGTAKSFCYEDKPENCEKYGRLYLWSAAMDSAGVFSKTGKDCGDYDDWRESYTSCGTMGFSRKSTGKVRGVCPAGWHLPSNEDFMALLAIAGRTIGDEYGAGIVLKSKEGWSNRDFDGTDALGFGALPAGFCSDFVCVDEGEAAGFWSSMALYSYGAFCLSLEVNERDGFFQADINPECRRSWGGSVRCIKD